MIQFTVPGLPVAQPRQRHRVVAAGGRTFTQNYTPKGDPVNTYKAAIQLAASVVYKTAPITGPVAVTLLFLFPRPKSMVWARRPMPRAHKATKPDIENVAKAVLDALTGQLWVDDAQVASLSVVKLIAAGDEQPHTFISIERLEKHEEDSSADDRKL